MSLGWLKKATLYFNLGRKEEMLLQMIAGSDSGYLEEAAAIVRPLFGECELTVVTGEERKILHTTVINNDCLEDVKERIKRFPYTKDVRTGHDANRNGVISSEWIVLPSQKMLSALYIEHYSVFTGLSKKLLSEQVLPLVMIAIRMASLSENARNALSVDESTMLPTRDAMVRAMELHFEKKVGFLSIDNYDEIYGRTKGTGIKPLQKEIASLLKQDIKMAYLIGENVFGFFLEGKLEEDLRFLSMVADRMDEYFEEKENAPIFSGVVSAQKESPYLTLYVCETYLRKRTGKIVIAREEIDERFTGNEIKYVTSEDDSVVDEA